MVQVGGGDDPFDGLFDNILDMGYTKPGAIADDRAKQEAAAHQAHSAQSPPPKQGVMGMNQVNAQQKQSPRAATSGSVDEWGFMMGDPRYSNGSPYYGAQSHYFPNQHGHPPPHHLAPHHAPYPGHHGYQYPHQLEYQNPGPVQGETKEQRDQKLKLKAYIRQHALKYVKAPPQPHDPTYPQWYHGLRKVESIIYQKYMNKQRKRAAAQASRRPQGAKPGDASPAAAHPQQPINYPPERARTQVNHDQSPPAPTNQPPMPQQENQSPPAPYPQGAHPQHGQQRPPHGAGGPQHHAASPAHPGYAQQHGQHPQHGQYPPNGPYHGAPPPHGAGHHHNRSPVPHRAPYGPPGAHGQAPYDRSAHAHSRGAAQGSPYYHGHKGPYYGHPAMPPNGQQSPPNYAPNEQSAANYAQNAYGAAAHGATHKLKERPPAKHGSGHREAMQYEAHRHGQGQGHVQVQGQGQGQAQGQGQGQGAATGSGGAAAGHDGHRSEGGPMGQSVGRPPVAAPPAQAPQSDPAAAPSSMTAGYGHHRVAAGYGHQHSNQSPPMSPQGHHQYPVPAPMQPAHGGHGHNQSPPAPVPHPQHHREHGAHGHGHGLYPYAPPQGQGQGPPPQHHHGHGHGGGGGGGGNGAAGYTTYSAQSPPNPQQPPHGQYPPNNGPL